MRVFFFTCTIVFSLYCLGQAQQKTAPDKPNIIFILADDLGYADTGCYGNKYFRTPNIDKLAKQGILFKQAYVASPVCSPSRAALMTGKYPARLPLTNYLEGRTGDPSSNIAPAEFLEYLPSSEFTMAEALQKEGYKTAMIGKWHLGQTDNSQPSHHGFDYERVANNRIFYYDFTLLSNNKEVYQSEENENLTDRLTDEAISFVEQNKDDAFFLYLSHFAPHLVMQPKPQKLPHYYFTYNKLSDGKYDPQYAATIETLDDNIGRLMEKLKELKLMDNTIIVFTSDNGGVSRRELGVKPTDNSPLREGKGHVYEGGIRVPLVIVWKDHITPESVSDEYINNTDFFPTFLELAGSKQNIKDIDGGSFRNALEGKPLSSNRTLYWHYPHFSNQGGRPAAAVRQGDYKLIEFYETGKVELYNLREDVSETNDLANKMTGKANFLAGLLSQWRRDIKANMPVEK